MMNKFLMAGKSRVIKGSILNPETAGLSFVLNILNKSGKLDNPLYPIFNKKWKKVGEDARGWFVTRPGSFKLGEIHDTAVQSDVWVIHLLCQDEHLKVDLKGLEECLNKTYKLAKFENASIHVSSILTSMIPELKDLLAKKFLEQGINVSIYDEK